MITGNITIDSKRNILSEISKEPETREVFKKVKIAWALLSSTKKMPDYKVEKSYLDLQAKILSKNRSLKAKYYPYLKYAAIFILLISISSVLLLINRQSEPKIANNIKYTSIIADYGQISKVILPDSSIVWLNSGTTLSYNNEYSVNNRDLTLIGQALLEVKKNKAIPLIVACNDLKVKVLGTKFDVCAYPEDEKVSVVLESGSVELLHSKNKSFSYTLKPGEKAVYNSLLKNIVIKEIKPTVYATWKDGTLIFTNTPMAEVIKKLERKFNVEITVNNPEVYKSIFNANFKDESLVEILDYIQYSCPIAYKIIDENKAEKSKIIFYGKANS